MATLIELSKAKAIHKIDPVLDPGQQELRAFYASPKLLRWLADVLPTLVSDRQLEDTPAQQFDALLEIFCAGESLAVGWQFHALQPSESDTWELKTPDIRIFGWFPRKDIFIGEDANTKRFILDHPGIVAGYRGAVVRFRDALALDPPKSVQGDNPEHVVSNYHYP